MNRLSCMIFIIFWASFYTYSQPGRLLLVGGGAEKNGQSSWSTPAYRWAGEGKKVAIVGTSTGSLAPYFMQQCGASKAKEFAIASRDSADSQATYDTLTAYDLIFFRGGDQYDYYRYYKNTKLQDAVIQVFNNGGTICGTSAGMHILSEVIFTAKNGTVYSDETIENPNNYYVTIEDDFLNLSPGFIFDTHFAERGRFGRLTGFLANYRLNKDTDIIGIGIDDLTCMTVDENGLSTVYGTGCANLYFSGDTYSLNGTKLLADTVHVVQLLHGCTYDFHSHQTTFPTLDRQINTDSFEETGNYTVLASGSNKLSENEALLDDLVNSIGLTTDFIMLLSESEAQASVFKDKLLHVGASLVNVFILSEDAGNNTEFEQSIIEAKKILFLSNNTATFTSFLKSPNGILLSQKVHESGMITAFIGDDSRFAGKTVVENYYTEYASYYAELTFSKGLSLLKHCVIMPNAFYASEMFENTATAVPYCMALDTLKYGIWLTNHNYMKYSPVEGKATLSGYGSAPVMVLANKGHLTGFSTHTSTGSNSIPPRMIAGFEQLQLTLIDYTNPYILGDVDYSFIQDSDPAETVVITPNPVHHFMMLKWPEKKFEWKIFDIFGNTVKQGWSELESETVDLTGLLPGLYFAHLADKTNSVSAKAKFIKQ